MRSSSSLLAPLALLLALAAAPALRADVVHLADGRKFTGQILERSADSVTIKTLIASVPVTIRLAIGAEDRIEEKNVPAGYFEPKKEPVPPPEGTAPAGSEKLYLEIPIRGTLGEEVVAEGVRKGLDHALRSHVKHIVFTIDSRGGDYTEAMAIHDLLRRFDPHLEYHAVIENAEGIAMAVPIWCDTIHIRSTGRMGGVSTESDVRRTDESGRELTDDALVARAAAIAESRGLPGIIIAAMVVPEETIEAWRDESGEVRIASSLPEDAAVAKSIFKDGAETRLTLTGVQAAEIGIAKTFDEDLGKLGEKLSSLGWTPESDFGVKAMTTSAAEARTAREKGERSVDYFHGKVEKNVKKHSEAVGYVLASLAEFREYDPRKGDFETIKVNSGGYDWSGYYHYNPKDTHEFTKDSKYRWKLQTDQSLRALDRVRKGIQQIERLDKEAEKLGIVRDSAAELGQYVTLQEAGKLELNVLERAVISQMERLASERNREGN